MNWKEEEKDEILEYCLNNPIISYLLLKEKVITKEKQAKLLRELKKTTTKEAESSYPSAISFYTKTSLAITTDDKNSDIIQNALHFITNNYAYRITLSDVASEAHLNPAYFSSLFKQITGISFKEYLNLIRIEESKRLLTKTEFSIVDIAMGIGFEDQSYFSKVFKKYTGLTPKQFRNTSSTSSSTLCP